MSENLKSNFTNPTTEDYKWKAAIDSLLSSGDVLIPQTDINEDILKTIESNILLIQILIDKPIFFIKSCNIQIKDNPDKSIYLKQVYHKIHVTLDRAKSLGLVEVSESKSSVDEEPEYFIYRYSLSKEGLQTALKLQEHKDNKLRYQQTKKIMIGSMIAAFLIASLSLANLISSAIFQNSDNKKELLDLQVEKTKLSIELLKAQSKS